MGDENPIRTLGDYSKPSHEGYKNTIKLPVGNNMVPFRSDTIREEAKSPVTKSVNSIPLIRDEEEKNNIYEVAIVDDIKETGIEVETKNEAKNGAKNKPIKKAKKKEVVEAPSSRPVEYYLKHRINEKLIEGLVDNQDSMTHCQEPELEKDEEEKNNIYEVAIVDDIKETGIEVETKNEAKNGAKNKPIKKAKKKEVVEAPSSRPVEYYLKHRINEKLIEGLVDNQDSMTHCQEPELEKIKLHVERKMEFNRKKSKNFRGKHLALVVVEAGMDDEEEVMQEHVTSSLATRLINKE
nr:hypothetical protein [Tanacetum cinerariifolium]